MNRRDAETQSCGVAQVSKPAVSPISKSARLSMLCNLPVWKPALRRSTPSAAPTPVLRSGAEAGYHGIVPDVAGNSRLLIIIPNPVIVGFRLPERLFAHAQNLLGAARGELFPRFQNVAQQIVRHRPDDGVGVVGHYNPFMQQIPALMKVSHRVSDKTSDVGPAQVTSARALIKIPACVNARAKRTGSFVPRTAGVELMTRPLQAGIRLVRCVRLHGKTVIDWIAEGERVWKPATQQTWKSALLALR